ncbi:MAG TPA: putative solute-binding protein [Moraxellaceae bacterium]
MSLIQRLPLPLLYLLAAVPACASAQVFCVYDPMGTQGEVFSVAKDYQFVAKTWGVNIDLKAYTDERVAAEDFKAGQCDGVAITGLRARQFNTFTGSIDAIGAVPDYTIMRKVLDLLASPKLAPLMVSGPYEVAAIIPIGAAYPFVNDRSINTLDKAAGKKIAVLDWDKTQARMVQQIGAQPVASDITNFASKFNNGQVDIIVAPIIVYQPLELYRGLGTKGAIARFPVIQLTGQVLIRHEKFPPGFGQRAREYALGMLNRAFGMIRNEERGVNPAHWMHVPVSDRPGYVKLMREARISMTRDGLYDKRMMSILKRVRCKQSPDDAECAMTDE